MSPKPARSPSYPDSPDDNRHTSVAIESDGLLDILSHANQTRYPKQRILVVSCDDYVYLVPFVEEEDYFFLKTVIPSRKATRDYLNRGGADAEN